jgi:putative two-component system response regulator
MRMAGLLHDIGKIGVPDRVLNKPGKLTESEFRTVMSHPVTGDTICRPLRSVRAALPLIRHHHERYDGSGYPDKLAGEAIPLGARVLALADAFDALTSERSYRRTLSTVEALDILRDETTRGKWDPRLFSILESVVSSRA